MESLCFVVKTLYCTAFKWNCTVFALSSISLAARLNNKKKFPRMALFGVCFSFTRRYFGVYRVLKLSLDYLRSHSSSKCSASMVTIRKCFQRTKKENCISDHSTNNNQKQKRWNKTMNFVSTTFCLNNLEWFNFWKPLVGSSIFFKWIQWDSVCGHLFSGVFQIKTLNCDSYKFYVQKGVERKWFQLVP